MRCTTLVHIELVMTKSKFTNLPTDLDHLFNQLTTAILLISPERRIVSCNSAAETLLDCSQRRLIGLTFEQLFEYCSFPNENISLCLNNEQSFSDSEVTVVLPDGTKHELDLTISTLSTAIGTHALIECKAIDVQKRISHETMQEQQQIAARDLVRGLAHEIKNPLGGLRGAAQLLEKQLHGNPLTEFTSMIIEQADRLRGLVDRLLGPNKPPRREEQNVHIVLEKVRQLVLMDVSDGITVIRDYDPSIPDIEIDIDQIQQAILNIVVNAVHALDGSGMVRMQTRVGGQQTISGKHYRQTVAIKVIDSGPGISPRLKDTLFYPMVTDKADGTGLGLSIAQTLIHQHGGRIDCESHPGCTEFTIYLPMK